MRLLLPLSGIFAFALCARGQWPSLDPTPTPAPLAPASAPPLLQSTLTPATSPARFRLLINSATPAQILSMMTGAANGAGAFISLLKQANAATQLKVVQAMSTRAGAMTLDKVETTDVDVMAAALNFAMQDPRYTEIEGMSYFGVKLSRLKEQIATDGMTTANKAALISLYHDAIAALQAFLAAEAAADAQ